jgi:hypothetical protein
MARPNHDCIIEECAIRIRATQIRVGKVRTSKVGFNTDRPGKSSSLKYRLSTIRSAEISVDEITFSEVGTIQACVRHARLPHSTIG